MESLKKPPATTREDSPCHHCTEKVMACHDRCPKDKRGEYGYKAWLADLEQIKAAQRQYERDKQTRNYWWRAKEWNKKD